MSTHFTRSSFIAVCALAILMGAPTSAHAMLLPDPGGPATAQGGGNGGHVVDPVIVTTVPWHLIVPISLMASLVLAIAFAASFITIHTRHAAHQV